MDEASEDVVTSESLICQRHDDVRNGAGLGCDESKSAVGSVPVVVTDVDGQDVFEVAAAGDEEVVEALSPDGADPTLGVRVRDRVRTGVRIIWTPTERHTSSKGRVNLVSRSRIR